MPVIAAVVVIPALTGILNNSIHRLPREGEGNDNDRSNSMQTEFCKQLGIEAPIFAFTHCRDVVVAVSKAGGIGVLGAVGFSAEQLKEELDWIL